MSAETRDHLILSCPVALVLWSEIIRRVRDIVPVFWSWSDIMCWMSSTSTNTPSTLRILVVEALVYTIWQQRNNMLHNQTLVPQLVVFKEIVRHIKNSINAPRKRKKFSLLMPLWLIWPNCAFVFHHTSLFLVMTLFFLSRLILCFFLTFLARASFVKVSHCCFLTSYHLWN